MADIRTLKLQLLADTAQFSTGLNKAENDTESFSSKIGDTVKKAALAFAALAAAAGAAAIKIGVDSVKAAIEDEKAQATLAQTLRNTVKATDAQIKSTEKYIDSTARATGVADDQLRPSLDRLVRSTNDLTKAQKLQQLALDISAGTGKDLATVTEALGKAYDGNLGALKRIGVPLDETILKTKDFDKAVVALSTTFAGQADIAANTFAGRMERIKIAVNEAKETLGFALLPIVEKFATFTTDVLMPALEDFISGLTGSQPNSVKNALKDVKGRVVDWKESLNDAAGNDASGAYGLGIAVRELATQFGRFNAALSGANGETGLKAFIDNMTKLLNIVNALVAPFAALVEFSQNFAQSQSQARIELPSIVTGGNNGIGGAVDRGINNVVVNISGVVGDKTGVAKTVTKAITSAAKQGTVNKLAKLNLR